MLTSIELTNRAGEECRRGRLWFGLKDTVGRKARLAGIAKLLNKQKKCIGTAFVSPKSRYYLRVFSKIEEDVNVDFWQKRIAEAYRCRQPLIAVTDAFRVVHAEADGIPSVVIDKYNDIWAVQISSAGAETIKSDIIGIIEKDYGAAAIVEMTVVIPAPDKTIRGQAPAGIQKVLTITGSPTQALGDDKRNFNCETIIKEGERRFKVNVLKGQKTGAYLDYRALRLKAREFAKGRCLDAFCYEGWFACQIAGLADLVVAIDSSAGAIAAAKSNAELNGIGNIEFVRSDVFDYLEACADKFDFIHLDPPSFAKGRGGLPQALAGYKRLTKLGLKVLKPAGILMISSCSQNVTEEMLERTVTAQVEKAGFECEIVFRGRQDIDHPILATHPESLYLKAIAARVI